MDILMTYWNSVWRTPGPGLGQSSRKHSLDDWAAYDRSLKRNNPIISLLRGKGSDAAAPESVVRIERRRGGLH